MYNSCNLQNIYIGIFEYYDLIIITLWPVPAFMYAYVCIRSLIPDPLLLLSLAAVAMGTHSVHWEEAGIDRSNRFLIIERKIVYRHI